MNIHQKIYTFTYGFLIGWVTSTISAIIGIALAFNDINEAKQQETANVSIIQLQDENLDTQTNVWEYEERATSNTDWFKENSNFIWDNWKLK